MTNAMDRHGQFSIVYIPKPFPTFSLDPALPLQVRTTLGSQVLAISDTGELRAGHFFRLENYVESAFALYEGQQQEINFDHRFPVPLVLIPKGSHCLVGVDISRVGPYARFSKHSVREQVVDLEDTVSQLIAVANAFLHHLNESHVYKILDNLEPWMKDLVSADTYKKLSPAPYQFDTQGSLDRVFSNLQRKRKYCETVQEFEESLNERQYIEWCRILEAMQTIDSDRTAEEVYHLITFALP